MIFSKIIPADDLLEDRPAPSKTWLDLSSAGPAVPVSGKGFRESPCLGQVRQDRAAAGGTAAWY